MQNFKLTVINDTESLEAQALFQKLGFIQGWNAKKDEFDEPNHIFAGKGAITWLHNDRIAFENHPFEEITLQQLRKMVYSDCHVVKKKENVIISNELEFLDKAGWKIARLILEENWGKHTGIVDLEIGLYEGRATYSNLNQPLDRFLKTESLKHLIFKAFKIQQAYPIKSGEDFIKWVYQNGIKEIKQARKSHRINAIDLRSAYEKIKQIDDTVFASLDDDLKDILSIIYGESWSITDHLVIDARYEFLANALKRVQSAL